jgi:hypothetical protein
MRRELLCLTGLVIVLGLPSGAAAQEKNDFWLGFGVAAGHARIDCSMCGPLDAGDPWKGGAGWGGYVAAGGVYRTNMLLGLELNFYSRDSSPSEREAVLASLAMTMQYYPQPGSRLFVKGGAGVGMYSLVDSYYVHSFLGTTSSGLESFGFAVQAGVGYEHMVRRNIALVPFANVVQLLARGERDPLTGAASAPSHPRHVQLGLGVQWY